VRGGEPRAVPGIDGADLSFSMAEAVAVEVVIRIPGVMEAANKDREA